MNEPSLESLQARGARAFDPVRLRFIEALARRASAHEGEARKVLDLRLSQLIVSLAQAMDGAQAPPAADTADAPAPGPLAELVEHIARHAPAEASPGAGAAASTGITRPPELKTLRYFRSTWSRLAADQRLTQSLAKVPENAGPLHSHHLVHRALTLMREASPEYLQHFMAHVDALLWLEQARCVRRGPSPSAQDDIPPLSS
jgi:hypothetical protein